MLILAFISIAGNGTLSSCTSDEITGGQDYCNIRWTLNHNHVDNLLFDYENTDTVLYKRTVNNKIKDTVVFVKQTSYHDTLRFYNGTVDGDPNCSSSKKEFTRERISWKFISQYDNIFFNVQVVSSGEEGNGFDDLLIQVLDTVVLASDFFFIGNYGVDYERDYSTSEKIYDYCWRNYSYNKREYTDHGKIVQDNLYKTSWQSYYNIEYGIIEIFKNDRTEVWELIP